MPEIMMPTGTKSFVVTSTKRKSFRVISQSVTVATSPFLLQILAWIPHLGTVTPLEFDISYGPNVLSATTRSEYYVAMVDIDNLPTVAGVANRAIWGSMVNWVSTTQVGINQSLSRDVADFFNPASFSYSELADFTQRSAVCFLVAVSGTVTIHGVGVLTWQEDLIQRVFGGDSATFDDSDQGWIDDFADEEEGDYE